MEAILLIVVGFGVFFASMKFLKESGYIQTAISGPFESLSGMIESGVWVSPGGGGGKIREQARALHPNQNFRGASSKGDGNE